ncbi:sulfotransferase family 2 domain-containing protein [Phycobacter sp. K97]|uniref:sulfotransferase family 2 domain-containing protein n=1 Tax=Phycobacter sedimenti TaxID=3133977 RepID=UPI00311E35B4
MLRFPDHAAAKPAIPKHVMVKWLLETFQRPYFFVHIPKCGGTSVVDALQDFYLHGKASVWRKQIGTKRWDKQQTFALVRRPYERICSLYRYASEIGANEADFADLPLNEWIERSLDGRDPQHLADTPMTLHPCLPWVVDANGAPLVKLIIRLEEVNQDWPLIQRFIGRDIELAVKNKTKHMPGTGVADLSDRSIELIESYYAVDFDNFGYERLGAERKLKPREEAPLVGITSGVRC